MSERLHKMQKVGLQEEDRCDACNCRASRSDCKLSLNLVLYSADVPAQVLGLVELQTMRYAVVARLGEDGLSVEQRKRLSISVELIANVFMDEPTSRQSPLS